MENWESNLSWSTRADLNHQPADYKSAVLPLNYKCIFALCPIAALVLSAGATASRKYVPVVERSDIDNLFIPFSRHTLSPRYAW